MLWIRLTPKLISRPGPADDSFSPLCCTCRSGTDGTNYVPSCSLVLLVKKLQHFNDLASRVGVLPLKSECKVIAFFNTSKIFRQKSAKKVHFFLIFAVFWRSTCKKCKFWGFRNHSPLWRKFRRTRQNHSKISYYISYSDAKYPQSRDNPLTQRNWLY